MRWAQARSEASAFMPFPSQLLVYYITTVLWPLVALVPVALPCPEPLFPPPPLTSQPRGAPEDGRQPQSTSSLFEAPLPPRCSVKIIQRIPCASQEHAGMKLASNLGRTNDRASGTAFYGFPPVVSGLLPEAVCVGLWPQQSIGN